MSNDEFDGTLDLNKARVTKPHLFEPGPGVKVVLLHDPNNSDSVSCVGAILDPDDDTVEHQRQIILELLVDASNEDDIIGIELTDKYGKKPEELDIDTLETELLSHTDMWLEVVLAPWL